MKPKLTLKSLKMLSISACLLTLAACETVEGIKQDISNISFDDFRPAVSADKNNDQSQFLIDGDCPQVQIVEELGMLSEFPPGNAAKSSNLISSVTMNEAQSTCSHGDRSVTVDLKLAFDGKLGPKGRSSSKDKPFFSYPFFVAVTSSSGKILAKEIFAASMTYDAGQNEQLYFETLRQIIPADNRAQGASYKVMVGFQLAEQQLAYNRDIIEAERLAAEKAEMERIEAERLAAEKAKMEQKKAEQERLEAEKAAAEKLKKNKDPSAAKEISNATTTERAGPFDIFKTDEN